jgi:hypothetical protein
MADILKKLAAVVFLTMLIWAWAYLALEETMPPQTGTLDISPGIRQDLFVSFENQPAPVSLKLTIKGPTRKIAELKKRLHASNIAPNKERLDFLYDPASQGHSTPGSHVLKVVEFLNESDKLKDMAVTVESCEPAIINVKVEELTKKRLTIQCLDEHNALLADASIEPASIEMFARGNWTGTATVILSEAAIVKSRKEPVTEIPFIELSPGKRQYYKDTVDIKLPSTETLLTESPINLNLGYIFSKGLQGKYKVALTNEGLFRTRGFRGTAAAIDAYRKMEFHVLIEVQDRDASIEGEITRPPKYNFPAAYFRNGEIELAGPSDDAIFKLVPVSEKPE